MPGLKRSYRSKYGAVKAFSGFDRCDSKKEAARADELKMLEKSGFISDLRFQVPFELQPHFRVDGKMERAITYVADAVYVENGKTIVEDTKSPFMAKNPVFRIKKKLFLFKYPDLTFREYT